jgi:hypothetical protein
LWKARVEWRENGKENVFGQEHLNRDVQQTIALIRNQKVPNELKVDSLLRKSDYGRLFGDSGMVGRYVTL